LGGSLGGLEEKRDVFFLQKNKNPKNGKFSSLLKDQKKIKDICD